MDRGKLVMMSVKREMCPIDIFRHYGAVKQVGKRYKTQCPNCQNGCYIGHNGMFHCFQCGTGGSFIEFVALKEDIPSEVAMDTIVKRHGIYLSEHDPSLEEIQQRVKKKLEQIGGTPQQ